MSDQPLCVVCGSPRSKYAASKCRACFEAGKPQHYANVATLGGDCGPEIQIVLTLKGPLADALLRAAAVRQREPADVLADLIETALTDNLFDAILDDAA